MEKSFGSVLPELAKQWNYEKNGTLTPFDVACYSNKKVWWKCDKGHKWEATVDKRTQGRKCPYCQGKKICLENSLMTTHPTLVASWNFEKNYPLKPSDVSKGSERKVWWKCENGHEWEAVIYSRVNGRGCPYCKNVKVNKENSLETNRPDIACSWNYIKNKLKPSDVTVKSNKRVWWVCEKGHEWEATVYVRTQQGCGCPYCANKITTEETSLATNYPEVAQSWDYKKNFPLTPSDVTSGSSRKVWWTCEKGHEWEVEVVARTNKGNGCPYCSNHRVWIGNCMAVTHPEMAIFWNYEKNHPLTPYDVTHSSNKKVWWKCEKGHEWEAKPNTRSSGNGCPYCVNQMISKENSIAVTHPHVSKKWHNEKNYPLTPDEVSSGSNQLVWWTCERGHEHQQRVNYKVKVDNCPVCNSGKKTSFVEQSIYFYLKQVFTDTISQYKFDGKREIDIWIPTLRVAIEYDGQYFHENPKKQSKDMEKDQDLGNQGIKVIRVKEKIRRGKFREYKDKTRNIIFHTFNNHYSFEYYESLDKSIVLILKEIQNNFGTLQVPKIDSFGDRINIQNLIEFDQIEKSLGHCHPELINEWHTEKNGELTPFNITRGSKLRVWWKCKENHEWKAPVCNRTKREMPNKCPICFRNSRIKKNISY